MPPPVTQRNLFVPATNGNWLTWIYWLSTFCSPPPWCPRSFGVGLKSDSNWPEALLLLAATFSTLTALARQLPGQNVLLAAFVIALHRRRGAHRRGEVGSSLRPVPVWTANRPEIFQHAAVGHASALGRDCFEFTWRGAAGPAPWRKMRTYGFWLIGMTALFTMLFDCALEPFASHLKHYWIWTAGRPFADTTWRSAHQLHRLVHGHRADARVRDAGFN
ncbi:MAG: hypothetical protein WDN00_05695 [Limisphaerales bacterium]